MELATIERYEREHKELPMIAIISSRVFDIVEELFHEKIRGQLNGEITKIGMAILIQISYVE